MKSSEYIIFHHQSTISPITEQKINQPTVDLNQKQWSEHMPHICEYIKEWKISRMRASYNKASMLIKQIEEIKFTNLTRLFILENQIYSIESLNRVHMPKLTSLGIGTNFINSIQTLKKGLWQNLEDLFISENKIKQIRSLSLISSYSLKMLFLEYRSDLEEQSCDIRILTKIPKVKNNKIENLLAKSKKRIKSKTITKVLEKKHKIQC